MSPDLYNLLADCERTSNGPSGLWLTVDQAHEVAATLREMDAYELTMAELGTLKTKSDRAEKALSEARYLINKVHDLLEHKNYFTALGMIKDARK